MEIHKTATIQARIYAWGGAIILSVVSIIAFLVWGMFGIILGLFIGLFGSKFLENKLTKQKGILTKQDGAMRYEIVNAFINDGWTVDQPTA